MYTYLIGFVDEVRPISRADKKTGEFSNSIDVTITFEAYDYNGFLVKNTETVNFDFKLKQKFDNVKNKYIGIPYRYINTRSGSYMFPDDSLDFQVFESNPFIKAKK